MCEACGAYGSQLHTRCQGFRCMYGSALTVGNMHFYNSPCNEGYILHVSNHARLPTGCSQLAACQMVNITRMHLLLLKVNDGSYLALHMYTQALVLGNYTQLLCCTRNSLHLQKKLSRTNLCSCPVHETPSLYSVATSKNRSCVKTIHDLN
jgi:hypothetical protein